ncbi:hypothetical protein F5148DRAFT_1149102 [Russula earlei]|uniref:Uncharacterized protein n=1 Tax=Russula earlei TaxID=71964 RepID=A0ACC0U9D2_9AGAM|nr:hypothetical protein F5148DRAFT_1149102 [Russula earlei]
MGRGMLAWCWCRCLLECGRGVAKQEGAWRACGVSNVSSRRGAAGVVEVVAVAVVFAAAAVVAEASGEPGLCGCRADVFRPWHRGLLHSRWRWDVWTIARKRVTRQEGADGVVMEACGDEGGRVGGNAMEGEAWCGVVLASTASPVATS